RWRCRTSGWLTSITKKPRPRAVTVASLSARLDARKSGSFRIGGDIEAHRLGFGAMRITGPGRCRSPADRVEAIRTLRRVSNLGLNFIDTADSYGPDVSEQLIREALYPYDGVLIATKAGLRRPGPGQWEPDGRPEYLRQQAIKSLA